jgi:hypothetical protein
MQAGTCQHTCTTPDKCGHAWTLRYRPAGRQREQSFRDDIDDHGRVRYGGGKRKAKDAQLKVEHDKRAEGESFIHPRAGREDFGAAVDAWISRLARADGTRTCYVSVAGKWVKPAFEGRTVAQVASDRERVADLLAKDMAHLSTSRRRAARLLVTGVLDEAVRLYRQKGPVICALPCHTGRANLVVYAIAAVGETMAVLRVPSQTGLAAMKGSPCWKTLTLPRPASGWMRLIPC